jgi:hypothetical protein
MSGKTTLFTLNSCAYSYHYKLLNCSSGYLKQEMASDTECNFRVSLQREFLNVFAGYLQC